MSKKTLKQKYERLNAPKRFTAVDLNMYESFHYMKAVNYADKGDMFRAFRQLDVRKGEFRPQAYDYMTGQLHLFDAIAF